MITFFRRIINSKVGIAVAFLLLAVIAVGFAMTDIQNLGGGGAVAQGSVAKVGGRDITTAELTARVQQQLRQARQQTPGLDMAAFIAGGGVDGTLERMINGEVLQAFGNENGVRASDRLVDGEIASIPAFRGLTGKFDQTAFRQALAQQDITEAALRGDIARDAVASQLIGPIIGARQVPVQLTLPYAQLLLEQRAGQIAVIPAATLPAGPAPTEQEVQAQYRRDLARYTVPERRIVRYAAFDAARVAGQAQPTEAEVTQAYAANRQRYAGRETRSLSQVIVADQAGANALAGRVRGGTALAQAAQAAGLEATRITDSDKAGFAAQSSAAVADAAYAAAQGSVVGPVRSPLGWHVIRVERVTAVPARTLADARDEIVAELSTTKREQALADFVAKIEDDASSGASLAEVAQKAGLTLTASPAVLANGSNPDAAPAPPAAELAAVLSPAFEAELSDDPQVSALQQTGRYVLWDVDSIVPATPRPLAQVREAVVASIIRERQMREARRLARAVTAAVGRGTPLEAALAQAGVRGGRVERVAGTRAQLTAGQQRPSPALALMFSMASGTARYIEAPNSAGFIIIRLDRIVPGDISRAPQVVQATRAGLARVIGQEYAEQFVEAARAAVGVSIDRAAVEAVKRQLLGQAQ